MLGRYSGATPYSLGGKVFDVKIQKKATTTKEPGTGQRKLASIETSGIHWIIDFKMKVQILTQFITAYCMITAEGTLPSFSLYTYDGITKRGFTSCYVNTCQLEISQSGAIIATIQVMAIGNEDKDLTITDDTEAPMVKSAVTTLTLGASLAKWTKIAFGVNNNVEVVATGNGAAMTEIYAKQAEYSGNITFAKTGAIAYGYSTTVTADLIITLTDNQATPVAKTFTFDDVRANSNDYYVSELGLTFETVQWDGDELAIT